MKQGIIPKAWGKMQKHFRKRTGVAWGRKCMAFGLVLGMTVGMLSGCGSLDKKGSENLGERDGTGESKPVVQDARETKEQNGDNLGELVAMGRYVEREISLPKEAGEDSLVSVFLGRDGVLELYTAKKDSSGQWIDVKRFLRQGDDWKQEEGWWDRVKPKDISTSIRSVIYGLDGKYYFSAMEQPNYICHLYQIPEEGESIELLSSVFLPKAGETYGLIPPKIQVGKEGNILIYGNGEATWYQPDGEKLFTMEKSWGGSSDYSIGFVTEDEFITKTDEGITRYSLKDGQKTETVVYEGLKQKYDEGVVLFGDGNGGIYVANKKGLAHGNKGGSLWELLIDGSLNTMGMESMGMADFFMGTEKDYYGAYVSFGGNKVSLYQYVYDPNAATLPPQSLTVYGLTDNSTVRQAASVFQKNHPDVKVEVLNGADLEGNVSEETIRSLNTELLAGRGADVLILDGLPMDSYEKKGILMDLRDVFDSIQKEDPIMEQVVEGFTKENGSIYQMPARISVPVIMGQDSAIQAFSGISSMAGFEGEMPLMATGTYENLLRLVAHVQKEELFGKEDLSLTKETLIKYLETIKVLGDESGSKEMFTEAEMENLGISNHVDSFGMISTDHIFDQGKSACSITNLYGMFDCVLFEAVLEKHPEARRDTINGIYFPKAIAGVNQKTENPELAKEFVRQLFSTEVQKEELFDGFPVGIQAQKLNCASDKNSFSISSGYGDYSISGSWPKEEKRKEIYKLIESVSVPVQVDETIMNMIVSEAMDYLNGRESAEQAADAILRQVMLYQAEQE